MLRKLFTGLFVIFVGVSGLLISPLNTSAATYSKDGKSPVATGCNKTGVVKSSKSFSVKTTSSTVSGTVYLMYNTSCKTSWSFVRLSKPLPSKHDVAGWVERNNDKKIYGCWDANGNGSIKPGQTTCYSPMVYDLSPNTSYASVDVLSGCSSSGCVYYYSGGRTRSY
ncbi:YjfA family protein [Shimazuella sp. AN120528]|uniref:DUF2690 domain-containing protein n=1 Tax=Shimazuella soli TaxID=1892854 RepID=UPI001F116C48|nr:DUF2690 domain-containing protein [Shimazuella soli]MCH5586676.1 YjfA family protein [Shimazuella soli]